MTIFAVRADAQASPQSARIVRRTFGFLFALLSGLSVVFGVYTWRSEEHYQLRYLETIAQLSGHASDAYFKQIETSLQSVARSIPGVANDPTGLRALLLQFVRSRPGLAAAVARPDGALIAAAGGAASHPLPSSIADPSFVAARARLLAGTGFDVGRVARCPLTGRVGIPLRYAVRDSQGRLMLILTAIAPLAQQQALWRGLPFPEQTGLGLIRDDGFLVSWTQARPNRLGPYARAQDGALVRALRARGFPASGWTIGRTSVDGMPYFVAYHRLDAFPLTAFATLPTSVVWAQWRRAVELPYFLLALLVGASFVFYRHLLRRQVEWDDQKARAASAIAASEARLAATFEQAAVGMAEVSLDHAWLRVNQPLCDLLGYARDELMQVPPARLAAGAPWAQDADLMALLDAGSIDHYALAGEFVRRDGSHRFVNRTVSAVRDAQGRPQYYIYVIEDIDSRKRAEDALARATRALRVLGEGNHALVHALDEDSLLQSICQTMVDTGGYKGAWVGMAQQDAAKRILPVAWAGAIERYVAGLDLSYGDDDARGQGPSGRVVRENRPVVVRSIATDTAFAPWRDGAARCGLASTVALPLRSGGAPFGVLGVYADQANAFDEEEVRILTELADDLAFGIVALRTRKGKDAAERALALAASALENTVEGIVIVDGHGRVKAVNRAFTHLTGFGSGEVLGHPAFALQAERSPRRFRLDVVRALGAVHAWQGEVLGRSRDGSVFPALLSVTAIAPQEGEGPHYVAVFNDISQRKDYERQLEFLANHDLVTGLPNRVLMLDRLQAAIQRAAREGHGVGVLFIDLDRFKLVNDSFGHAFGDRLLSLVAQRLTGAVRAADSVGRLGGDEFTVVLDGLRGPQEAAPVAQKLLDVVAMRAVIDGHETFPGASLGVSFYPQDGQDAEALLRAADIAMYRAKEDGRGRYRFFSTEMNARAHAFMDLVNDLHRAVERQEFFLEYQPRTALASGRIAGVEALVRWRHPARGRLGPQEFIAAAEDTGLIVPLGAWVLQAACAQGARWMRAGWPVRVAVNLSARQFREDALVDDVTAALAQTGYSPDLLELEITESLLMREPDQARVALKELVRLGVKVAIDDFGTGYSSLSYLKHFPVHYLKIDRTFVRDIPADPDDVAIVRTLIAMSRTLKLTVIAEGVETREQLAWLRGEGCDEVQGFYFSPPRPADEVEPLFAMSGVVPRGGPEDAP